VRTLVEVALVDADLVGPQEAVGLGKRLGPEVPGYVESVGEVGKHVERYPVDEDGLRVGWVSGAVRYRCVLSLDGGERDGRQELALDKAVAVIGMEPDKAHLSARGVQRLVDASSVELVVVRSRENIPAHGSRERLSRHGGQEASLVKERDVEKGL
jgi:hypothetical protein